MKKYICIAVLLVGFLSSCTSSRSMIGCPAYAQTDTTQIDSVLFVVVE